MLYAYVEGDIDYEYCKKGEEEKKSVFNHYLFSFGNSSFFEFSRKDDLINKNKSYSWNARNSSAEKIKIIVGNYHAKFSSGMILSRLNSSSDNPFLSSTFRTQSTPFLPESNANNDDSLFGSAINCSFIDIENLKLTAHLFYSDKKTYVTSEDYENNETDRSYLSLNSSEGAKNEEVISSKISGGSMCFGYDLLKLNVNGLWSLAESRSERLSSEGNDYYSAFSAYFSFGVKQSEIFSEISFNRSKDNGIIETLSYQYGLKHSERNYMISFVGKNISENIYLPFGSPYRGKSPSVQNTFSGYLYIMDKIKTGAEIVQTQYKKMNQSETHSIDEKVFTDIEILNNIYINGEYCRRKYYWKTDEVEDSFSTEVKIYFKYLEMNYLFARNDDRKKIKSEIETRSIRSFAANIYYVGVFGNDSYYSARNNISLSMKYLSKNISSAVSLNKGFGKGQKYTKFIFSISGLI